MSHKRRKHGLAASVAGVTPASPTPVEATLHERVKPARHYATYAERRLWDRAGRPWRLVDEFVEPQRALQLARAGTPWLVEWCGGPLEWPTDKTADRLLAELRSDLVSVEKGQRLSRRRTVPTVVIVEEWQDQQGSSLVVFIQAHRSREPSPASGDGMPSDAGARGSPMHARCPSALGCVLTRSPVHKRHWLTWWVAGGCAGAIGARVG